MGGEEYRLDGRFLKGRAEALHTNMCQHPGGNPDFSIKHLPHERKDGTHDLQVEYNPEEVHSAYVEALRVRLIS